MSEACDFARQGFDPRGKLLLQVDFWKRNLNLFDAEKSKLPNCNLPGPRQYLILSVCFRQCPRQKLRIKHTRSFWSDLCSIFGQICALQSGWDCCRESNCAGNGYYHIAFLNRVAPNYAMNVMRQVFQITAVN